ncbi:MAG: thiol peroxidase [Planctomycetota bacterium]
MTERTGLVTLRGNPVTLLGSPVSVGESAPDFVVVAADMGEKRLSDFRGRTVVLTTVPSVETKVCDTETRTFNERATSLGDDVVVLTVSMDLPMAQKRWCAAAGVDRVELLSDYRYRSVSDLYGVRIRENGLLARAVFVIDPQGVLRYEQIVPEVATEPDYDAALAAAAEAAG